MAPTEEGLAITRESVTTFFATDGEWPFHIPDISPLWDGGDVELVNRQIAGSDDAEVPYPPAPAPSRRAVTCQVFGAFDLNGDPVDGDAEQRAQLQTNMAHLITDVVARVTSGDGTVDVELFGVDGDSLGVRTAQFAGPLRTAKGDSPAEAIVTLDLYFAQGVFTLTPAGS
jgi:hypothetical protein